MLILMQNQPISTLFKLLLVGGLLLSPSLKVSALPEDIREETCLQFESQQGGIADCENGFNAGYEVGVTAGQNSRQNNSQPSEPDVEKEFGDRVTTSYKEGYLSGYRVGFQGGYQN
ncbi:hypothetical protein VB834_30105 [Limnoraphis robusta Tam1]|uniref:hypothetical protein n=1 Tax=Limnoraphis robusta TaxID=1118279 RepID=UPI002B1F2746|nr:hypothetical protein [Limnoraphis robusta]MEA5496614.1 hypothetical protein [Limnoraphis robusta BA-68 BA1]MEA5543288.1 hypothetical protein [Limnoraphis robusta Tam1]